MSTASLAAAERSPSPRAHPNRLGVIAALPPLIGGAAPFNAAMVTALRGRVEVELLSWRRLYPPFLYRGPERDERSTHRGLGPVDFALDWHNPRTWRAAVHRLQAFGAEALILPWLHPVSAPPYSRLLARAGEMKRVVVCHNVVSHEPFRGASWLTRSVLSHADLLVTHAPQQADELRALGLGAIPVLPAFHPRFVAENMASRPAAADVAAERRRLGDPGVLLLFFGAVRPYKGLDLALEAVAQVDPAVDAKLVVAGRFWEGRDRYERTIERLGIARRVELRDGYVSDEEAALLFSASDGALLPYRSATQSGVAQLAFAYGKPVVATRVGGLSVAVEHGRTGLLCPRDNAFALARAVERLARERQALAAGVLADAADHSFDRYAELLLDAIGGLS
jgi:glycosyltransferase involved in cell wall biosynthesis